MKVDGSPRTPQLEALKQQKTRKKGQPQANSADRNEQVSVSEEARSLTEARAPEVPDQERIDRLKEAISNGTFKVDVNRIASQMLDEEL